MSSIQELTTEMSDTIKELEANLTKWAPDQISTAAMKLAILNITLGVRVAEMESEALQLKTAREIESASIFLKLKNEGATDKTAENQVKIDTQELKSSELKSDAQAKKIKAIVYHTSSLISTAQSHLKAILSDKYNLNVEDK